MNQFVNKNYLVPCATLGLFSLTSETTEKQGWKETQGVTCFLCCPKNTPGSTHAFLTDGTLLRPGLNPSSAKGLRTSVLTTRGVLQRPTCTCLGGMAHLILLYDDTQHHKFAFSLHQAFAYLQAVITFPSAFYFGWIIVILSILPHRC